MNEEKCGSAASDQHSKILILNLWTNWEKRNPNFSFTVKNKMGDGHKIRWFTFQT